MNTTHPSKLPLSKLGRRHGWKPDKADHRDFSFARLAPALPATLDLRTSGFMPKVYDQSQLGSCTANGWACCYEFDQKKQGLKDFMPSRLFIYYYERVIDGTVTEDSGAQIRDGAKVLATNGCPTETVWPYNIHRFAVKPSPIALLEAAKHKAVKYERVNNSTADSIKHALVLGFPVVFGCTLFENFESAAVAANGMVPMPVAGEQPIGGHCMVIVGYTSTHWIVRNSWGTSWGDKGYCYMPIAYLTNTQLASDFWVLETVTKA